jgi:undecaprenyl diphosphate synthase
MAEFKRSEHITAGEIDRNNIPRHIAIILDGNGRWAKEQGKPRTFGHAKGAEAFRTLSYYCQSLGINYLTVYAFSTENWKRSKLEVSTIMKILGQYLQIGIDEMIEDQIKMRIFGDVSVLSKDLQALVQKTNELDDQIQVENGFQANLCINYGGRDEIVRAAKRYAEEVRNGVRENDLSEADFSGYMCSAGIPDPELLIRPGGEKRLSNFLLWQCAYSEFYYTDTLWPDFTPAELDKAILAYQKRDRRFGGVKEDSKNG